VSFIREALDWEVDDFVSFFQALHSVKVSRGSEDKLWWVSSKKGLFKIKSFFYSLASTGSSRFRWRSVWRTQAPSRAAFFVWSAALSKILTLDNLRMRHVVMINRCYMCKKTGESVDHLLLHCDVAFAFWSSLFSCFGMSWVMPKRVVDLLACWWSSGRPRSAAVWKMTHICLFWCLCREETIGALRIWKVPWKRFYPRSTLLCPFGLWLMSTFCLLLLLIFLLAFLFLIRCLLVYSQCTKGRLTLF
jgi:hypothetical protein